MKYASEVIDLLGAHPHREFRMMEIVNFAIGSGKPRKEREAARKAIARVLEAMESSGSITKTPSPYLRGGYSTYKLNSTAASEAPMPEKFGILGRTSHAELKAIQRSARESRLLDPLRAFTQHRSHAQARGIDFQMTFCEWWGVWEDKYALRGNGPDDLCMGRFGDMGPYAVGNVYITSNRQNLRDYQVSEKEKEIFPR